MDVGIVATHVPPAKGYGGVSVTCGVLTQAWAERGHRMALVASDESISGRVRAEDVQLGDTVEVRLYRCYGWRRWGFGLGAVPALWQLCRQAPRVYIHGIATWPSTLAGLFCRLLSKPFIVAVHGGLMPDHVALIKSRKPHKWLFYRWLTFPTLRRALAVHCTSDTEAAGVSAVLAGRGEDPVGAERYRQSGVPNRGLSGPVRHASMLSGPRATGERHQCFYSCLVANPAQRRPVSCSRPQR